jgi:hypothetical protein
MREPHVRIWAGARGNSRPYRELHLLLRLLTAAFVLWHKAAKPNATSMSAAGECGNAGVEEGSGFDPLRSSASEFCCDAQERSRPTVVMCGP